MSKPALADRLVEDAVLASALVFAHEGKPCLRAHALERWTFRIVAAVPLPAGARIAVAHRWPNDWGIAQSTDPSAPDYLAVHASGEKAARWWSAHLHHWHPFDHVLFVELPDGLAVGECVELRYGEASGGSPGFHVQSFIEEASPFSLRWSTGEDSDWVEFARHEARVVGAEASRLVLTAPAQAIAGVSCEWHLRVEDAWGNPAILAEPVELRGDGVSQTLAIPESGWIRFAATLRETGVQRLQVRSLGPLALVSTSNPVDVRASATVDSLFWGDLHGQSLIGCGARSIDAYYAHARDFAASDFCSHQANCFLVTNPQWEETQASTRRTQSPGRFVTLLGVEWSAASPLGGDHNLYFPGDRAPLHRCSHEFIADRSDIDTDLTHIEDVYRHYRDSETLIAVHVGGRTADLSFHDPQLDRLLEVHSTHATSEWFLFDALRRGYRMGVIAGSDGVDGRPGNSHPGHMSVRNVRGGLTAILAPELSLPAIWKALKARHCYATTGERILLEFRCGEAGMGDELRVDGAIPDFEVRVEGTAPMERVDFFCGTRCLQSVDLFADAGPLSNILRVAWRGASAPGNWQRARMDWRGGLRVAGARIVAARGWAFDTPDEGILRHDERSVDWRSVTAGDWDGVLLELDRPDEAEVSFVTSPIKVRTHLSQLAPGGRRFDATNPDRRLELRRLPERMPAPSFAGRFRDTAPAGGPQAYWIRVRQADGAHAWSSPIFVDAGAG